MWYLMRSMANAILFFLIHWEIMLEQEREKNEPIDYYCLFYDFPYIFPLAAKTQMEM